MHMENLHSKLDHWPLLTKHLKVLQAALLCDHDEFKQFQIIWYLLQINTLQ